MSHARRACVFCVPKATKFFERVYPNGWAVRDPIQASSSVAAAATYQKMQATSRGSAAATVDPRANLRARLGAKFVDQPLWHAFVDLILAMLHFDPVQRIKPAHALEHDFFLISKQIADAQAAAAAAVAAVAASVATRATDSNTSPAAAAAAAPAPLGAPSNGHAAAAAAQTLPPVQSLSTVFSDAAAAAFTYPHAPTLPPPAIAALAPPTSSAAAAAALAPDDAPMQDVSSIAPAVPASLSAAPAASAPVSAAASREVVDVTTPTDELLESKRKPAAAATTANGPTAAHATPTRKRSVAQVDSSPPSPTAPQHTPKTRALAAKQHAAPSSAAALFTPRSSPRTRPSAASAAAAAAGEDAELHALELPPISYQSPSLRSMNRQTSAKKDSSGAHAIPPPSRPARQSSHAASSHPASEVEASAAAAATSTPRLTRRTSELLAHHDLDSPQPPPAAQPSSPQIHGMLTRRQSHALASPPGSSPLSPGLHSHTHGPRDAWVATQERLLASDPLALALDERSAGAGPHPVALSQAHLKGPAPPRRTPRRKAGGRRDVSPDESHRHGNGSGAVAPLRDDPSSIARHELRVTRRKASGCAAAAASSGVDSGNDSHSGLDTDEPEDGPTVTPRRTRARSHELDEDAHMKTKAPVARKPAAAGQAAGGSARKARS